MMIDPDRIIYREGTWQMRPALLGWQWRSRPYGQMWPPGWAFRFGRQASVRAAVQDHLGPRFTEVPWTKGDG